MHLRWLARSGLARTTGRFVVTVLLAVAGTMAGGFASESPVAAATPPLLIAQVAGGGSNDVSDLPQGQESVNLWQPAGIVADAAGNLYIAEQYNGTVDEMSNGKIVVMAGGDVYTPSTSPQPAIDTTLTAPSAVALSPSGNLYIADPGTGEVYEVTLSANPPELVVVAGGGADQVTTDPEQATSVSMTFPNGLAFDAAGDLFIADTGAVYTAAHSSSGAVYEVQDGQISLVAGGGSQPASTAPQLATDAQLSAPSDLAVDSAGNLFISDYYAGEVDEVPAGSGQLMVVAGGRGNSATPTSSPADATSVALQSPIGLTTDSAGDVFIVDAGRIDGSGNQIGRPGSLELSAGLISVVAGEGGAPVSVSPRSAVGGALHTPLGLASDGYGDFFISDWSLGTIDEIGSAPIVSGVSPRSGLDGTRVTVTGSHLADASAVLFGSTPASKFSCTATSCTASAPRGPTGLEPVRVVTGLGISGGTAEFTYEKQDTTTRITLATQSVPFGQEELEKVSVSVRLRGGTPDGKVLVSGAPCSIVLTGGKGSCVLPPEALPVGSVEVMASYEGNGGYKSSVSSSSRLRVTRGPTVLSLSANTTSVTVGKENRAKLHMTVTSPGGAVPTGRVRVAGVGCSRTLSGGAAVCTLVPDGLSVGRHRLRASYGGSTSFLGERSAVLTLTVKPKRLRR